jgi:hypothetical protein
MGLKLAISGHSLTGERVDRRWLLAADVAGYSRLMGANEEGTLPYKYKADGSLDLYFQNESPGADSGSQLASSAERLIQLYHAHFRPEIGRPHWEVEPAAGQKNSEGNWSDSAIRIRASVARTRIAANVGSWHKPAVRDRAEYVRSARVFQTPTCSAIARASSTSMPRYLTVLSILLWPSRSRTALRLPVRR